MSEGRRAVEAEEASPGACSLGFERPTSDTLLVRLSGSWQLGLKLPGPAEVRRHVESTPAPSRPSRMSFDTAGLTGWDTGLLTFLDDVIAENDRRHIETDRSGLPGGVQRLLTLAAKVPRRTDTEPVRGAPSWLARLGIGALTAARPRRPS